MPKLPFGDKGGVRITFDYGGTNLVINPTFGKTSLRVADKVSDVQEEEWGDTPVDAIFVGTITELDVPLARSTILQIVNLFEGIVTGGADIALFHVKSGCAMYENSKPILLQPLCDNVPDFDSKKWILIYKAFPYRDFDLGFDRDSQRVHMAKFKIFPSQQSGHEGRTHQYGV